jgi:receptor protein-tyrosine kinase
VSEAAAIQKTQYPNVDFIGAGAWRRTGPELLASPAMRVLLSNVRSRYKVILVDSSPLGAGVDPFVLGTVTGSLLMVLRTGATDRDLAGAKLDVLQRLPIRILGAVMNGVPARGAYRYYSYLSNYQLPPGHGEREPAEV